MSKEREALKALIHEMEYVLSCINAEEIPFDDDDFHEALRLGKEALDHLAQQCVCGEPNSTGTHRTEGPCLAPQPEQEPAFWYSAQEDEFMTHKTRKEHERLNSYTHKVGKFNLALYTAPYVATPRPQRTAAEGEDSKAWVGLTNIDYAGLPLEQVGLVRWAEAKLKEKNNG